MARPPISDPKPDPHNPNPAEPNPTEPPDEPTPMPDEPNVPVQPIPPGIDGDEQYGASR